MMKKSNSSVHGSLNTYYGKSIVNITVIARSVFDTIIKKPCKK